MAENPWQQRVQRAQELALRHAFAAENLGFYVQIAHFQEELYQRLDVSSHRKIPASELATPALPEWEALKCSFESCLERVEAQGLVRPAESAREAGRRRPARW